MPLMVLYGQHQSSHQLNSLLLNPLGNQHCSQHVTPAKKRSTSAHSRQLKSRASTDQTVFHRGAEYSTEITGVVATEDKLITTFRWPSALEGEEVSVTGIPFYKSAF